MPKVTVVTLPLDVLPVTSKSPDAQAKNRTSSTLYRTVFITVKDWLTLLLYRDNLPLNGMAFLLARVSVLDELFPFGLAFLAALAHIPRREAVAAALWSIVGIVTVGNYRELFVYIITIVVYSWLVYRLRRSQSKLIALPLVVFGSVLVAGMMAGLWYNPGLGLYGLLLVLFEAAMCVVMTQVFLYAAIGIKEQSWEYKSNETLICILIALSIATAGVGDFSLWGYSIRNMIGAMLIMGVAMAGGAGMGAAAGVLTGLAMGLTGSNVLYTVSVFSLGGMLGGLFQRLGRFAVALGYILGITITISYGGQARDVAPILTEAAIGVTGFIILSFTRLGTRMEELLRSDNKRLGEELLLPEASEKLRHIASVFSDLSVAFSGGLQEKNKNDVKKHLSDFLSVVTERVCRSCQQQQVCWKQNFYRTYQDLITMMGLAEEGRLSAAFVSAELKQRCVKHPEVIDLMIMMAEHKRINNSWQKEMVGTRQMISGQLKATGNIMQDLAREILRQPPMDGEKAAALKKKAGMLDCVLESVHITGKRGTEVVEVSKQPCDGVRECLNTVLPLATGVMQEKMTLHAECGDKAQRRCCRIKMQVSSRYGVQTGIAAIAKGGGVSGDTYSLTQLNKGKVALLLSDGMGSGKEAADESLAAVDFLQRLLSIGFDVGLAVRTLNSLLVLQLPDETFATMDMAVIDTYSGEVEFIKVGSAPSFVKRVREVSSISGTSLPIGVFPHIEIQPVKITLKPGDLIVMVSDGVADVSRQGLEKECWIANSLRCTDNYNPQEVADTIFQQALQRAGNKVRDDMTVLVARIIDRPEYG